ncbi:MAG: hypothetical protein MZU97_11225 [Bacillus subtilis]|nr:hypothetical protein [Bacillus subtilis]
MTFGGGITTVYGGFLGSAVGFEAVVLEPEFVLAGFDFRVFVFRFHVDHR